MAVPYLSTPLGKWHATQELLVIDIPGLIRASRKVEQKHNKAIAFRPNMYRSIPSERY
jgi:hypothetical protein